MDRRPLLRFLKKTVLLYGIAILLYLPVNIYAGHFQGAGIGELIRKVLFDGTFYRLWYLPAVLLGVPLVCWAGSRLPFRILGGSCLLLYLIGLFGDSYYGFIANSPIASFYDVLFHVFSYTRNGLFYVPIFLVITGYLFCKKDKVISSFPSILNLYIVDVDDEFQRNDEEDEPELKAIVYNTTGSNSYGNGIAFDDIDSIELDPNKN